MASRRAGGKYYNSTTDGDTSDEANLVLDDNELSNGRRKKYIVSDTGEEGVSCNPRTFSRNEWICLVVGIVAVLTIIVVFIAVGVSVGSEVGSSSSGSSDDPWKNVRLPKSLTPDEYSIHLTVDLSSFSVEGSSVSTINVIEETKYIIIHAKDMTILSQHVTRSGETLEIKSNFSYAENDFYILSMDKKLSVGTVQLDMTFTYDLRDDLVGFYKSSYKDKSGTTHWLASTQFEPTDARRAFPCFDEPALKANFSIMLTHDSSLNAHSNMPVESVTEKRDAGMATTKFWPSVKMSTYLVAFVVSDFVCVTNVTPSVNVSVCSNPDVIQHTAYALEKATDILLFYVEYFNIPFPLPKEDLFAIPDFAAGAMENWGLITYRETAILYDPEEDPETSKQRVAVVIAHELAHQWFGNLVTMEWWDGLWLNEGFATYTEYVGTNHAEPSFDMLEQFFLSDVAQAFSIDGLNESHPIVQTVSDPDEINELFDTISYSKGGTVIRMIKNFLGADKFQDGITYYLNAHRFGNAETSELWEALQTQVDASVNVSAIMDTWTLQMGYPVLDVDTASGKVTQERFFYLKPNGTIAPSPYDYVWMAPFNYLTENEHSSEFIKGNTMLIKDKSTTVNFPSSPGFIKVNYEQTGFYRVNYDLPNWYKLIQHLLDNPDSEVLSPGDRAGLINDAFALSSAGMLDARVALNLSRYLKDEREYVPLSMGLSSLGTVGKILGLTPTYGVFQEFLRNLTSDLVQEYGFNRTGLGHLEIFMRTVVLSSAWFHGNTEVIDAAKELFRAWKEDNETVDADLKSVVYPVGVSFGTVDDWDFVWEHYLSSTDPHEKRLYLSALAQSRSLWILNRYLQYSISDKVRIQDSLSVISAVSRNIYGRRLAWDFVRENWEHFKKVYGGGSFSFSGLIRSVTTEFTTELELKEVQTFFEQQSDLGSGARAVRQATEIIKLNIKWLDTNTDLIYNCLTNQTSCFTA